MLLEAAENRWGDNEKEREREAVGGAKGETERGTKGKVERTAAQREERGKERERVKESGRE